MQAAPIVPAFQELEYVSPGFIARQVVALLDELTFQRGIEALHRRVVPAIALAAHRADDAVLLQPLAILVRCELHTAVRMVSEPGRGTLTRDGHVERGERQLVAEVAGHGPADHAAGEQVEHHGQVQPALGGPDVGQILSANC